MVLWIIQERFCQCNLLAQTTDKPQFEDKHINVKESVAVLAAFHRWVPRLAGRRITIYTDNITTKAAIT